MDSRHIPRDTDAHLLRSLEELFDQAARCRLCHGTFRSSRWEGHLDYHRELFEEYRPLRAQHERYVKAQEEKVGLRLEAESAPTPTWRQIERHQALYGPVPPELIEAMEVERPKTPEIPASVVKRLQRRKIAVPRSPRLAAASLSAL